MQSQRLFILCYAEHQPPRLRPQEFVEQTKVNSGLDFDKLNKQPGFASETNVGTSPQQAVRSALALPAHSISSPGSTYKHCYRGDL